MGSYACGVLRFLAIIFCIFTFHANKLNSSFQPYVQLGKLGVFSDNYQMQCTRVIEHASYCVLIQLAVF